jgi:hypothetical protein
MRNGNKDAKLDIDGRAELFQHIAGDETAHRVRDG